MRKDPELASLPTGATPDARFKQTGGQEKELARAKRTGDDDFQSVAMAKVPKLDGIDKGANSIGVGSRAVR